MNVPCPRFSPATPRSQRLLVCCAGGFRLCCVGVAEGETDIPLALSLHAYAPQLHPGSWINLIRVRTSQISVATLLHQTGRMNHHEPPLQ